MIKPSSIILDELYSIQLSPSPFSISCGTHLEIVHDLLAWLFGAANTLSSEQVPRIMNVCNTLEQEFDKQRPCNELFYTLTASIIELPSKINNDALAVLHYRQTDMHTLRTLR